MTGLILPRHVAAMERQRREKVAASAPVAPASKVGGYEGKRNEIETDDFIRPEDVADQVTQFSQYDGIVPKPVGWRIALLVLTIPEQSSGGVIIVDEHREARSLASPQGVVISVGPQAYGDANRFPNKEPWVRVGDRVLFQKYGGRMFQIRTGQHIAILNDTEIGAVVDSGWLETEGAAT